MATDISKASLRTATSGPELRGKHNITKFLKRHRWMAEIEKYCEEHKMEPADLIKVHKRSVNNNSNNPKRRYARKSGNGKSAARAKTG